MSKQYTANKILNLMTRIKYSTPSDPVYKNVPDPEDVENTIKEFYAGMFRSQCQAKGNSGMQKPCHNPKEEWEYLGDAKSVPWTLEEVGEALKNYNNFNTVIYNNIKELVKNATNVTIS